MHSTKDKMAYRSRKNKLLTQLKRDRASWEPHWRDLGDNILPRRPKFFASDNKNRGQRNDQAILDCTATNASLVTRAGLTSGIANPSTEWFELSIDDPDMQQNWEVQVWLQECTRRMMAMFRGSNLYQTLPYIYHDDVVFGTAAAFIDEDVEDGLRCYSFPIGSYYLGCNARLQVAIFAREFRMTARQIVEKFGNVSDEGVIDWSNISAYVRGQYEDNRTETEVDIVHIIEPNPMYRPNMLAAKYKKYSSCYYEAGTGSVSAGADISYISGEENAKFLRESGYDYFPVLAPRWEISGEDVYGTNCPGMTSLGDVKQLQSMEERIGLGIEKELNPPMTGPSSLRTLGASTLPGDMTLTDARGGDGFKPAYQISPRVESYEYKQEQTRRRINDIYMVNIFLKMTMSDRREMTAREVDEIHAEKLSVLGPTLEQWNDDLFDPLIQIGWNTMIKRGEMPPPPKAAFGRNVQVKYTSILAKAQRLVALPAVERFAHFVGQVAEFDPNVLMKVDMDKLVETHARISGVPALLLRPQEQVDQMRAAQQEARAKQAQVEQGQEMARSAHLLAGADTSGKNALTDMAKAGALPG